jgi:hypothetical protein
MTKTRARANGEGSIFPYRNGYAAYAWVTTPTGRRQRKYVYGRTRDAVHEKWIKLQKYASERPIVTKSPTLAEYLAEWLDQVVKPNLAPATYDKYEMFSRLYVIPGLGKRRLDKLTVANVRTWLNALKTMCQCCAGDVPLGGVAGLHREWVSELF